MRYFNHTFWKMLFFFSILVLAGMVGVIVIGSIHTHVVQDQTILDNTH